MLRRCAFVCPAPKDPSLRLGQLGRSDSRPVFRLSPLSSEVQPSVGSCPRLPVTLQLVDIFLLNIAHQIFAVQEVGFQGSRQMQGPADDLILRHLPPGNFSSWWNHVGTPLQNEAD